MTEKDFVEGLKQKNEKVFNELVNQYQIQLLRLVNGFLHNSEEAKEIVQDVFVEVYFSIENFREESKLSTWIYRIAVNKSLNHVQKNKNKRFLTSINPFKNNREPLNIADDDMPGLQLENSQRAMIIKQAIGDLPESQRIAFVLNKYQDLSYKDIAGVMDISLSAVESLIHRAKLSLQKKLITLHKKNLL